jgi:deazaflavin-dependent oxidoreductase (nitroreductase family)
MNNLMVGLYRRTGGRITGRIAGAPVLLLTTTGRRSGQPHTIPLGYFELDDVRYVIASNSGAPRDPAWYRNLLAHPQVQLHIGRETYAAQAETASGEERQRLWEHATRVAPAYQRYASSPREIPIVTLRQAS